MNTEYSTGIFLQLQANYVKKGFVVDQKICS